jgi:hypothetical protein
MPEMINSYRILEGKPKGGIHYLELPVAHEKMVSTWLLGTKA